MDEGGIELKGFAADAPGCGNRLEFVLQLDRGHLAKALSELDEVLNVFPVRAG